MVQINNSVIKFGGTSVAQESKKIQDIVSESNPRYVVVSAPGKGLNNEVKVTDLLINLSNNKAKILDVIERFKGNNNA